MDLSGIQFLNTKKVANQSDLKRTKKYRPKGQYLGFGILN